MSKASNLAKVSAKGGFHLLWGLIISTIVSAIGSIFIARLLGSDQYGLYAVVLTVPAIISIFRDWGINHAIIRFTAQYRSENRINEIRNIFISGLLFEVGLGLLLSILSFLFADFLAINVFNRPVIVPLIQLSSFVIFGSGLIALGSAVFTGYEKMELNSTMLVCQSIFKTALILLLLVLDLGIFGAVLGFATGTFIASILGIFLIWLLYRRLPKPDTYRLEIKAYLSSMLSYSLPLSFANIITTLLPQFYAFLLPIYYVTDNIVIGNYALAMNFVVLITFFAMPVTTMMFPAFSKLDAEKDQESLRTVFRFSVKYAALLVVPIASLVICLAEPAVETLFGTTYDATPLFLALLSGQYLFAAFGHLSLNALLNGQGQTGFVLKIALVTGVIGFPFGYFMIMNFGVFGLIVSTLANIVPSIVMGLTFARKKYAVTIDWQSSIKILFLSAVIALLTYIVTALLVLPSFVRLIVGVLIFLPMYVIAILFSKTLNKNDFNNLYEMTAGLGSIGKILKRILTLMEKIAINITF